MKLLFLVFLFYSCLLNCMQMVDPKGKFIKVYKNDVQAGKFVQVDEFILSVSNDAHEERIVSSLSLENHATKATETKQANQGIFKVWLLIKLLLSL